MPREDTVERLLSFPARVCGPPGSVNGGWVCGTVAEALGPGPAEVTLRAPTPVDAQLRLQWRPDAARLLAEEEPLAEARPADVPVPPPPVPVDVAVESARNYPGLERHPFPTCVVCGSLRAPGDGMRVWPGPVPGRPDTVAAVWHVDPWLGDGDGDGVRRAAVWGVLDCPTGWVHLRTGLVAVLGRLKAALHQPVHLGQTYVAVARDEGREGRKNWASAGLYDAAGELMASAHATWITLPADDPRASSAAAGSPR
ncbi:MAG: PaaI family thioesterase [Frankiaceae bacterium]